MNGEETLLVAGSDFKYYDPKMAPSDITAGSDVVVSVKSEVVELVRSSVPLLITYGLQFLIYVTSIYSCGKLGSMEIAAASLALCTFTITGMALIQGFATALDSYCSQAYSSNDFLRVGMYFQRCSLMMLAFLVPMAVLWWFSASVLSVFVDDQQLVIMAQQYLRWNTLATPGLVLFETGKRFLQAQHIFNAGTYVLVLVVPANFVLHWLLVWHPYYGLGYVGSPIAISISSTIQPLLLGAYVYFIDGRECWGGINLCTALENWVPMLKLSIPGVIMIEAEYLAFEVLTILAARFGTEALAAQSITSNVASLVFQFPFSIAVAVSTRIGHWLGKEDLHGAKTTTKVSTLLASLIAVTNWSVLYFKRDAISRIFTDDEAVIAMSDKVLAVASVNQLVDALNVICAGVLRGQGRQKIGSILNLVSYYGVALPVGYVLAFHTSLEFLGLWYGLICGVTFLVLVQITAVRFSDWDNILLKAKESR